MECRQATKNDISFVAEVYQQNILALHGANRNHDTWEELMSDSESTYYIVSVGHPIAWFRIDYKLVDAVELGMLQVKPDYQHQGAGKYIISTFEAIARQKGYQKAIIHTTEDNHIAQALYTISGYLLTEIGPCTTADGKERTGYTYQKNLTITE